MNEKRCGKCDNCLHIERTKKNVLATVNPPFSGAFHGDNVQGSVDLWNRELAEHPCTAMQDMLGFAKELEKTLDQVYICEKCQKEDELLTSRCLCMTHGCVRCGTVTNRLVTTKAKMDEAKKLWADRRKS